MKKDSVLIIGAKSDIGLALAHKFGSLGYSIQLAARNHKVLIDDKKDIEIRYNVSVKLYEFDAVNIKSHDNFISILKPLPTVAICAVGYMGDQKESELDFNLASEVIRTNFEGPVSILSKLANKFEKRGSGTIIGISSVAGQRGRASNFYYGSAKAGFTAFLSGMRNKLSKKGVHVITVIPGFVRTKMIDGINTPAILTANTKTVAEAIYKAVKRSKNIIYTKKIWYWIMLIVNLIPEKIFKNLNL